MKRPDGAYTNLALLLSDQCKHTVKLAVYQDATPQHLRSRQEFGGSLLMQIQEVEAYLDACNNTEETFEKYQRVNRRDYPESALAEALRNALIHRSYETRGSTLIKIYVDRIEFVSPGGLAEGIAAEDIKSGISVCRNHALAEAVSRLGFAEAYGTGISRIFETYKTSLAQPKIEVTPHVYKLLLPNRNAAGAKGAAKTLMSAEENILEFIQENGSISRKQAELLLGVSQTAAGVILRRMVEGYELTKEGNSRNVRYFISKY